jgi:hypothetical protein
MIAPLRESERWTQGPSRALRHARRVVAESLLPSAAEGLRRAADVSAWKGWLFAGWAVVVAVAWFWYMLAG